MQKKYKLHLFDRNLDFESNSIIEIAFYAYLSPRFFLVTKGSKKKSCSTFEFDISDFVKTQPTRCQYDSFYMAFVSVFLTRSERDRLIKKIRGVL